MLTLDMQLYWGTLDVSEYNDGIVVVFKEGRLGLYRLVFRSMCWNIYSCNDKCPAEHGVLIVNPLEQNTVYQSPSPRGGLQTLCPLHLGIGVARKNTGWNNTFLTQRRNSNSGFNTGHGSPRPSGLSQETVEGHAWHARTLLGIKECQPLFHGVWNMKVGGIFGGAINIQTSRTKEESLTLK